MKTTKNESSMEDDRINGLCMENSAAKQTRVYLRQFFQNIPLDVLIKFIVKVLLNF